MSKRKGDKNIDDKTQKLIQASYIEIQNYSAVARIFNVDDETVRNIVKKDKDNISKLIEQKKAENTQSVLDYMETQAELKKLILHNSLTRIAEKLKDNKTTASDLTRIYGVIMDKELINYSNKNINNNEPKNKITIINSLPKDDE